MAFTLATSARYRRYRGLVLAVTIAATTDPGDGTTRSATVNVDSAAAPTGAVSSADSDTTGFRTGK